MAMAARGRGSAYTATVLLLALACLDQAYSVVHTVGGSKGWDLGVNYDSWAAGETFKVGDVLFFPYLEATHDVMVVNKAGYDACSAANAIASYSAGNDNVTLTSAGTHYYLCSVVGHCSGGMKLAVTVAAAAAPAPTKTLVAPPPVETPVIPPTPVAAPPAETPVIPPTPVAAPPVETPTSAPAPAPTPEAPTSAPAPVPAAPAPASTPATAPPAPASTPTSAAGTTPPAPTPPNAARSLLASAAALTPVALLASLLAL